MKRGIFVDEKYDKKYFYRRIVIFVVIDGL